MFQSKIRAAGFVAGCGTLAMLAATPVVQGAPGNGASAEHARIVEYWTPDRRAAAIPRDLVIDERGQGFLQQPDGKLVPYGRTMAAAVAAQPTPNAKPPSGGSATVFGAMSPAEGATIGANHTFTANVSDADGLRSVTFKVTRSGGATQSFGASPSGSNTYSVALSGFTTGSWTWQVVAKDLRNNTATSQTVHFTVATGGGGGGVVTNAAWLEPGKLQKAAGRIFFEMPANAQQTRWNGYVCSGTVVADGVSGRSVVLTAAHCVYDDVNKAFARSVLFIPDQDRTMATGTDRTCSNDPLGCWSAAYGVVDVNWTTRTFPDNIPWDYAFYVVNDTSAHTAGFEAVSDTLDVAAAPLTVQFTPPTVGNVTHALGYSYSDDPNFMYCAEPMTTEGVDNWWLPNCGLSGGSSGGPWVQPMSTSSTDKSGPVISVNSWGYTNQPGMAGPKLSGTSASCVFEFTTTAGTPPASTPRGHAVSSCN